MNSASAAPVFHDSIANRAYELFERRGGTHGHDLDDWLQAEREVAGQRTHRVGILIIGSLIWDRERSHREAWRTERLSTELIVVRAPIRYGRMSEYRKNTYTMLFSNEFCQDQHMGSALAVPCGRRIRNGGDLVEEAEALWAAERTASGATRGVSASWGAVGLLCNPRSAGLESIKAAWVARTAKERQRYLNFPHTTHETPAVDRHGMLNIPWPKTDSGELRQVDMLLATATQPNCLVDDAYPSPEAIAAAWRREPREAVYFHENRRAGITTVEDQEIQKYFN
jgi:hypothetical protein